MTFLLLTALIPVLRPEDDDGNSTRAASGNVCQLTRVILRLFFNKSLLKGRLQICTVGIIFNE